MAGEDPVLSFEFEGGDADEQQLNFYDAARFQYAAARLVYTLEHFRQTGRVLERIHSKVQADYRIHSPRPGSWGLDVVLVNSLPIAQMLLQVPIDVMIAYVLDKLVPANRARSNVVEIERERTEQSKQETRRLELITDNNKAALEVVSQALRQSQVSHDRLAQALDSKNELEAASHRDEVLQEYTGEIESKTSEQTRATLVSKSRGQVAEIGKPLLRSAEDLRIGGAHARGNIVYLNRRIVVELGDQVQDDIAVSVEGNVIGYQKETGLGKFRHPELGRPISFVVPGGRKNILNMKVIDAMKKTRVIAIYYGVRNKNGNVKYLIFENVLEAEE